MKKRKKSEQKEKRKNLTKDSFIKTFKMKLGT